MEREAETEFMQRMQEPPEFPPAGCKEMILDALN